MILSIVFKCTTLYLPVFVDIHNDDMKIYDDLSSMILLITQIFFNPFLEPLYKKIKNA